MITIPQTVKMNYYYYYEGMTSISKHSPLCKQKSHPKGILTRPCIITI